MKNKGLIWAKTVIKHYNKVSVWLFHCEIFFFFTFIRCQPPWSKKGVTWNQLAELLIWLFLFSPLCRKQAFRKFLPLFDRVLVERFTAETVSKGGIMLPEKSQGKMLQATVVAVGPGAVNPVTVRSHSRAAGNSYRNKWECWKCPWFKMFYFLERRLASRQREGWRKSALTGVWWN